jgi:hypothetical protein
MKSELHQKLQNKAVRYLWDKNCWITKQEVPVYPGVCDVWGIKSDRETYAIEVKVSKNDGRSHSQKYKEYHSGMANYHYIMCPPGILFPDQIDDKWGLLWYSGEDKEGKIVNKRQASFCEMTDRDKLRVLIEFLSSKMNKIQPDLSNSLEGINE